MLETIKKRSDIVYAVVFSWFVLSSFIFQKFYGVTTRFATLIIFAALVFMVFAQDLIRDARKGTKGEIAVVVLITVITALNLIVLHSSKGAFFVPVDMALILFTAPRVSISEEVKRFVTGMGASLMIWWYSVVHWEYGFNMAGLIFMIFMMMGEIFLEYMKNDRELDYLKYVQILLWAVTLLLEICYHARSAAVCIILYGLFYFLIPLIAQNNVIYAVFTAASTIGSIAFTAFYVALGKLGINVTILYKNLLSGREDIWAELWQELLKRPLTGIGSSYKLKSFFIFEVHNGLFDILSVHGVVVFALVMILLIRRLWELKNTGFAYRPECRLAAAGIYAMLFASYFENGFIVPPYSMIFFTLCIIACDRN